MKENNWKGKKVKMSLCLTGPLVA